MEFKTRVVQKDLVIVGAGFPAVCAAVQAARLGVRTALIGNRGYVGGNASAEIGVNICGASAVHGTQEFNLFARETGLIDEILMDNLYKNPEGNLFVWDALLMDKILSEPCLELFLNTTAYGADTDGKGRILRVYAIQSTTETQWAFEAPLFADGTGDGTLGVLAGAEYRYGREASAEFSEQLAPPKADCEVMPSTLVFRSKDAGHPVKYTRPDFAPDLEKTGALAYRTIPQKGFGSYCWFYELDGDLDQTADMEQIIQDHRRLTYSIWDYIKNSGKYPAQTLDLEYVSCIPGKRESRRLAGDYILTERDILNRTRHDDAVAHGGWSIDLHPAKGFFSHGPLNAHVLLDGVYQIPYRCCYSRNVSNLFMVGRCLSVTHIALGSVRVMATLAAAAQAVGAAAALCCRYGVSPRGVYESHLVELKNMLARLDQNMADDWIGEDVAAEASVEVSSIRRPEMMPRAAEFRPLEADVGLSLPVVCSLEAVEVLMRAKQPCRVPYLVYTAESPGSFSPERLAGEGEVAIGEGEARFVSLPVALQADHRYAFVVLKQSPGVEYAVSEDRLPGVVCSVREKNDSDQYVDSHTLQKRDALWVRMPSPLCLKLITDDEIYGGKNVNHGPTRPYGGANLWCADGIEGEFLRLTFPSARRLCELQLIADTDLDRFYGHATRQDHTVPRGCVRDFDVYTRADREEYRLVAQVKDNHRRLVRVALDGAPVREIRVVFHAACGSRYASCYGIRLYEKPLCQGETAPDAAEFNGTFEDRRG